jgi:NDP-sugar pyrophosphorylase family protein
VCGHTFLDLQLEALSMAEVCRFVLSLGHAAEQVLAHLPKLRQFYDVDVVIERELLGTGGAMLYAMHMSGVDECMAINGDTFLDGEFSPMLVQLNRAGGEKLRVATVEMPDRGRYGGLEVQGTRVSGFLEKGTNSPGPINAGFYRISRAAFGARVPGSVFSFEQDVMPGLVEVGAASVVAIGGGFIDIGVPEDYRRFCARYADK